MDKTTVAYFRAHRDELLGHLSKWPANRRFQSLGEAINWLRYEIANQRYLAFNGYSAFSNEVLRICRQRLVLARYFAWVEKAEASDRQARRAA